MFDTDADRWRAGKASVVPRSLTFERQWQPAGAHRACGRGRRCVPSATVTRSRAWSFDSADRTGVGLGHRDDGLGWTLTIPAVDEPRGAVGECEDGTVNYLRFAPGSGRYRASRRNRQSCRKTLNLW